jgi:hypothetical protein
VITPEAATVWPNVLKLLLSILIVLVALAEPDGEFIPLIAPAVTALCNEILLLLMLFVKVIVGALLEAGM